MNDLSIAVTAVIGGTGFDSLDDLLIRERLSLATPYGDPSDTLLRGSLNGREYLFLPRHGSGHAIPPHRINYRANIHALKSAGVTRVIAIAAVGGIHPSMKPGDIVVPHQVLDYTWGRAHTFFDGDNGVVEHIDFTGPYEADTRERILRAADSAEVPCHDGGVYATTQGPRLESAAEIDRLERDGADIVGMTGMPEAALAREAGLAYAAIAIVVNAAAGRAEGEITMDIIRRNLVSGGQKVLKILRWL